MRSPRSTVRRWWPLRAIALGVLAGLGQAGDMRGDSRITYQDHVLPLVETHCSKCHNPDKRKGDLDLTSYAGVMKGGGSGVVVMSGNADASKLFRVLKHLEDPTMPPNKPPLAEKDLEVFRKWIADGLLETAGGKAVPVVQPAVDLTLKVSTEGKPDGPAAMPAGMSTQPFVHTERPGSVLSVSSSPWAPVVALTGQKQILLYHADSLERLGVVAFTNGEPCVVRFSRSGRLLLAGGGRGGKTGRVALWDVATGKPVTVLGEEYDVVLGADISPDQTRVALGGPGRLLKIHATATGEVEHKIKKHTDWVTAVAFSPNGQLLASADRNGAIHVWDPENGQEILALAGHPACVHGLAWRGDSRVLVSCGEDGTLKTWEMETGKQVKSWVAHEGGVLAVACAHDGEIASAGRNGKVRTWDAEGGKHKSFTLDEDFAVSLAFTSDGSRLVAGTFAGKAPVWSLKEAKLVGELDANPVPAGKPAKAVAQVSAPR